MKWVKIDDGCEMPSFNEEVLIFGKWGWQAVEYCPQSNGTLFIAESGESIPVGYATRWARVELPEE